MTARTHGSSRLAGWIITLALLALGALFAADRLYNPRQFRIERVEVRGALERVDAGRVRAVVGQSLTGNYFSLSLPRVEAQVEQLPWVFGASVRRRWPDTLVVEVVEVRPVARWSGERWLNFTGDLVERQAGPVEDDLPLLSAPDERRGEVWGLFERWSVMFADNGLSLDEMMFDARGLWRLKLSLPAPAAGESAGHPAPLGMIVGRENAGERIAQFLAVLRHRLTAELPAMRSVDLRHPNGFAVGWKTSPPGAASAALAEAGGPSGVQ